MDVNKQWLSKIHKRQHLTSLNWNIWSTSTHIKRDHKYKISILKKKKSSRNHAFLLPNICHQNISQPHHRLIYCRLGYFYVYTFSCFVYPAVQKTIQARTISSWQQNFYVFPAFSCIRNFFGIPFFLYIKTLSTSAKYYANDSNSMNWEEKKETTKKRSKTFSPVLLLQPAKLISFFA